MLASDNERLEFLGDPRFSGPYRPAKCSCHGIFPIGMQGSFPKGLAASLVSACLVAFGSRNTASTGRLFAAWVRAKEEKPAAAG